ncbi:GNAT family N-acetyltransferase [Clostridium sp. B9]|uniref:GNAT family N-acetyltransferase n=1 Tax=Clostridium sp. B9 TaxID=3423224 RepID=UPI003D2EB011
MKDLKLRRFKDTDANEVSKIIRKNFLEVNIKDYNEEEMKKLADEFDNEKILELNKTSHMYVASLNSKVIGCGSIANISGSDSESILLNVFVEPELQGKGIGRKIVEALEEDEYFLRSKRVEVPSTITACDFYKSLGYEHKYNLRELDKEGLYKLEKFRYRLQYDQHYK